MKQLLENNPFVLMEAAIIEPLRRSGKVHLHDTLANAPLIYDPVASAAMRALYEGYMELARCASVPILICTPTWRANKARVRESKISDAVNLDAVAFLRRIRESLHHRDTTVKTGGLIGCKNDCYRPDQGLTALDAEDFHAWQIQQLAEGGVDFLIAETLPNVQEALGIAKAMEATGLAYIISFVISRDGCVLDGSSLEAAVSLIDKNTGRRPLGYMVNCAHPSFLGPERQPVATFSRLIGYQANASSLDHSELDTAGDLMVDSISEWGRLMLRLSHTYGVQILGGCCGTGLEHLQYLVANREPA